MSTRSRRLGARVISRAWLLTGAIAVIAGCIGDLPPEQGNPGGAAGTTSAGGSVAGVGGAASGGSTAANGGGAGAGGTVTAGTTGASGATGASGSAAAAGATAGGGGGAGGGSGTSAAGGSVGGNGGNAGTTAISPLDACLAVTTGHASMACDQCSFGMCAKWSACFGESGAFCQCTGLLV